MSVEASRTTPESYQLTLQESQFLDTLKNTQGDIFETLDRKDVFHGLKEIPYTILREQLAEQQLLQLFPKSHQLRQIINQFDHEMAYFKMRYSDPIIVQRFADASGKTFDKAKEYLDNILATARIVPLAGESLARSKLFHEAALVSVKKTTLNTKIISNFKKEQEDIEGVFHTVNESESSFLGRKSKKVFAKPGVSGYGVHELSHIINSGTYELRKKIAKQSKLYGSSLQQIKPFLKLYFDQISRAKNSWDFLKRGYELINDRDYFMLPQEILSRMMEIRYILNKRPNETIRWSDIVSVYQSLSRPTRQLIYIIKVVNKQDRFINLINTSF